MNFVDFEISKNLMELLDIVDFLECIAEMIIKLNKWKVKKGFRYCHTIWNCTHQTVGGNIV